MPRAADPKPPLFLSADCGWISSGVGSASLQTGYDCSLRARKGISKYPTADTPEIT